MRALALLLLVGAVQAQTMDCDPPGTTCLGEPARTVSTPAGEATVRWFRYANTSTPAGMWNWGYSRRVDLIECRLTTAKVLAAAGRVAAAISDPYAQFKLEIRAAEDACFATAGTQREYEFHKLLWLGCEELRKNPPASVPAGWVPADWCKAAPQPPVVVETWKATGGTIFKYSAGRLTVATVRKATVGASCDLTPTRVVVGSTTYMQLTGGAVDERTACAKQ